MTSWINEVLKGHPPIAQTLGKTPAQMSTSSAEVTQMHWYDSYQFQLGMLIVFLLAFTGYYIGSIGRFFKKRNQSPLSLKWQSRLLAFSGVISVIGFWLYTIFILTEGGKNVGPVIVGQPLFWLLIQLTSLATLVLTVFVLTSWIKKRAELTNFHRIRIIMLIVGGVLFIPWAIYWKLFSFFM
jgi:hypothetical protein